jgi:thymidine phosphorylase
MARAALEDGRAAERFERMVAVLGGPPAFLKDAEKHLPRAAVVVPAEPAEVGTVAAIDTRAVGLAVVELGGGRRRADDTIDHSVGLTALAGIGDEVGPGRPLALVHAKDEAAAARAGKALRRAYTLGEAPAKRPLIYEKIGR